MQSSQRILPANPRETSNCLSNVTFAWTIPLFKKGYSKVLDLNDIFRPLNCDRSNLLGDRLEQNWNKQLTKASSPSLLTAIIATFWREYGFLSLICTCNDLIAQLGQPLLLGQLLLYFGSNESMTYHRAVLLAFGILLFNGLQTVCSNQLFMNGYHNAMKVRVATCSLIYRKSLRLSQTALGETAPGKVVNLLSNDVSRFDMISLLLNTLWTAPVLSMIVTCLLWQEIGVAGLVGIVVILTIVLIQSYTAKLTSKFRAKTAGRTDQCIRLMDEIISGVQVIKMYAWEKPFAKIVSAARALELKIIRKTSYLRGLFMVFLMFTTRMAVFSTVLAILILRGSHEITASRVFMIAAYYHCVAFNFSRMFVRGVAEMAEFLVAIKRLQSFLELDEKVIECITASSNGHNQLNVLNNHISPDGTQLTEIIEDTSHPNSVISLKKAYATWRLTSHLPIANANGKTDNSPEEKVALMNGHNSEKTASTLNDFNIDFPRGKLIGVIGPVGSGKSSLLQALLRELPLQSGSLSISGSISYASQEPWLFAETVRQNILFGENYVRDRYKQVVKCCALIRDFNQFEHRDHSMIGEKGTLSGGQKARINLARACYRNAEIYLLDDPLSAVDAHVGTHIFNKCIGPNGYLAKMNATRILVTHQVHFLKEADWIVVLNNGKIEAQGTPADLSKSGVDFVQFLGSIEEPIEEFDANIVPKTRKISVASNFSADSFYSDCGNINEKDNGLRMEESSKGKVRGSIPLRYFLSGAHWFVLILLAIVFPVVDIIASSSDYWMSIWIKQERIRTTLANNHTNHFASQNSSAFNVTKTSEDQPQHSFSSILTTEFCLCVQASLLSLVFILGIARSFGFYEMCMRASQNLYESMYNAIVSTKMRFFDTNPSGRILNRFSKDIGTVDEPLPRAVLDGLQTILSLVGSIVITLILNPYILIPVLVMSVPFFYIRKIYLKTAKNIKRIEGVAKSPAFTHLAATLNGLSTVRAFKAEKLLINEFDNHQDTHSACWFMFCAAGAVFGFGMDILCWIFVACNIAFYMFFASSVSGENVGLALTQALSLTGILQWGVRQSADMVNQMTSAERILEYCDLEPEKQPKKPQEISQNWPNEGKIEFRNVFYRYFDDAEPVLRNLSFVIKPMEKIGVVGRTGAGKSSLIGAIFRLACVDGEILIDDIDTSTIRLQDLRKRIAIIPQDPVLFSGTLRRNLDPFEEYSDEVIWSALEKIDLKCIVSGLGGLLSPVMARGANYSVGQRQLLCLARAILRQNRIILMDEATANVDPITDLLIQRTIRDNFSECTVLTIAHRLHTIIDSDRVLVMDTGRIVELDGPHNLLKNKSGTFYRMIEALGIEDFSRLTIAALEKHTSIILEGR